MFNMFLQILYTQFYRKEYNNKLFKYVYKYIGEIGAIPSIFNFFYYFMIQKKKINTNKKNWLINFNYIRVNMH